MQNNKVDKYQRIVVSLLLMIVIIPVIILNVIDISPHKLTVQDNIVKLGTKSFEVGEIKNVQLLEDIDINRRIKGTGTLTYLRGVCKIKGENQDASVYIYKNKSPYIRIELKDGLIIYNDKNSSDTEKVYEKLVEMISINN